MELPESSLAEMQTRLRGAIEVLDEAGAVDLAREALASGLSPLEFFQGVIEPVLTAIGDAFSRLEVFLPDLMRAGVIVKAMQGQVLEPAIRQAGGSSTTEGAVVIGTAQGDIHDIGKNMVALMLQVNGFRVTDLGTNVATQAILDAARRENADIIALSSLLTTSLPFVKDVLARLMHGQGPVKKGPFVPFNCAAVPHDLVESQLFGHRQYIAVPDTQLKCDYKPGKRDDGRRKCSVYPESPQMQGRCQINAQIPKQANRGQGYQQPFGYQQSAQNIP